MPSQNGRVLGTPEPGFLIGVSKPMSKSESVGHESTGTIFGQLTTALARSFTIGIDATGRRHHYYAPADVVVVFDEDGVDEWQYLDGRTIRQWYSYVAQSRGWESRGPHAALGERVDAQRKGVF